MAKAERSSAKKLYRRGAIIGLVAALLLGQREAISDDSAGMAAADAAVPRARALAETIYVPAYSYIYTHTKIRQFLASTLVVHNVDPTLTITVRTVRYYDQDGSLLNDFLNEPVVLAPFASSSFLTPLNDTAGGVGANYIIEWNAETPTLSPITEAVMIGGSGTLGISFSTAGQVIDRQ